MKNLRRKFFNLKIKLKSLIFNNGINIQNNKKREYLKKYIIFIIGIYLKVVYSLINLFMVRYIYFFLKANKKIKDPFICNINKKIILLLINFQ